MRMPTLHGAEPLGHHFDAARVVLLLSKPSSTERRPGGHAVIAAPAVHASVVVPNVLTNLPLYSCHRPVTHFVPESLRWH